MGRNNAAPSYPVFPSNLLIPALTLALAFTAMRVAAMFGPGPWRNVLPMMFVAMAVLPWILLGPDGRREIGLRGPLGARWLALSPLAGAAAGFACFGLGAALFGAGPENWFVSVANSYRLHPTPGWSLLQLHLVFTLAACLFSPIGEEIFFRGFLPKVLQARVGPRLAVHLCAALFALVHLCHHGVILGAAGVALLPLSAALWVAQMYLLSLAFAWLRDRSGSVWPAIVAHAAFNAAMNVTIFQFLWN